MIFDGDESEQSLDQQLEDHYQRFKDRLRGRNRDTITECYQIIDPFTMRQIELAATRAAYGPTFKMWAENSRVKAGYGREDLKRDPR